MNRRREWWSFQPLTAGTPPTIADNDWSQHPIDLHILAGLREKGLAPAADARRRARMGDIQTFKNSRLVGEGRDGLLVVLEPPEGSYGKFVAKTVAEENADRLVMMRQLATERSLSLEEMQKQQGELWRNRSFSGEWIEKLGDGGNWAWVQKQ